MLLQLTTQEDFPGSSESADENDKADFDIVIDEFETSAAALEMLCFALLCSDFFVLYHLASTDRAHSTANQNGLKLDCPSLPRGEIFKGICTILERV